MEAEYITPIAALALRFRETFKWGRLLSRRLEYGWLVALY